MVENATSHKPIFTSKELALQGRSAWAEAKGFDLFPKETEVFVKSGITDPKNDRGSFRLLSALFLLTALAAASITFNDSRLAWIHSEGSFSMAVNELFSNRGWVDLALCSASAVLSIRCLKKSQQV